MAPTTRPTPAPTANSDPALSTAAIVMIVVGVYLALVALLLVIRQCLKSQGISICPTWISELCCGCCANDNHAERCCLCACFVGMAEMCDCSTPSKKSCLDSVCPSKQWCDSTFCCCMNAEPGGELCQDCQGPQCACGDCNCACNCALPECNSINCICFSIDLGGESQQQQQMMQQQQQIQQQQQQLQQLQMQQQQFQPQSYPNYPR